MYAFFKVSVLLPDAAFGRREAPGRRLAGGGGALRAPLAFLDGPKGRLCRLAGGD